MDDRRRRGKGDDRGSGSAPTPGDGGRIAKRGGSPGVGSSRRRLPKRWVAAAFLGSELPRVRDAGLVPATPEPLEPLLCTYLLEKAAYELGYELDNREILDRGGP